MIGTRACSSSLILLMLLTAWASARAQEVAPPSTPIVVRPAVAPTPALKFRLLPERSSLIPGNAAVFYHRAMEMYLESSQSKSTAPDEQDGKGSVADEQAAADWIKSELESIPRNRAWHELDKYLHSLREARLGARRQTCNWEFDSREEGLELSLPEINAMRSLTRLVALRARLAILDRNLEEAIDWIQTGFAMARHVSEGPWLIEGTVGCAMAAAMTRPVEDLIQMPGTPSLFWALANRPRPLIDLSAGFEGERFLLEREIPRLRDLDKLAWSLEQAQAFSEELRTKLFNLAGYLARGPSESDSPGMREWTSKLGLAALVAQAYPEARRALIAQGRAPAQVEAMPAIQVAALHTFQSYQRLRDGVFKWTGIPYDEAFKGMDEAMIARKVQCRTNPLLNLFTLLVPAVGSVRMAQLRVDRQLDAIQCIEAIRIYSAAHGMFPSSLKEIADAPVPLDVGTGQPFRYRSLGDHAALSAPSPAGTDIPQFRIAYDLKWNR